METPPTNPPEAPEQQSTSPFSPGPPARSGLGGNRTLLFGCGALLVLLGIAAIVFLINAKKLFVKFVPQVEQQIYAQLPEDATAEDRRRLERGFAELVAAVQEDRANPEALQRLQGEFLHFSSATDEELTRVDVLRLIRSLELAAGLEEGATQGDGAPALEEALPSPP